METLITRSNNIRSVDKKSQERGGSSRSVMGRSSNTQGQGEPSRKKGKKKFTNKRKVNLLSHEKN